LAWETVLAATGSAGTDVVPGVMLGL